MDTERLGRSPILNRLLKPAGWLMASSLRKLVFDPQRTLEGARLQAGDVVLEVGCGTGFFTVPAAQLVGEQGKVIALDVMVGYLEEVATRVARAGLQNVELLRRDALDTGLGDKCVDTVLLFGVVPFPSLPLKELLPEMHPRWEAQRSAPLRAKLMCASVSGALTALPNPSLKRRANGVGSRLARTLGVIAR
jgi:SAM-dependent methyltransferase